MDETCSLPTSCRDYTSVPWKWCKSCLREMKAENERLRAVAEAALKFSDDGDSCLTYPPCGDCRYCYLDAALVDAGIM